MTKNPLLRSTLLLTFTLACGHCAAGKEPLRISEFLSRPTSEPARATAIGKTSVTIVAAWQGVDPSSLNGETPFDVRVGAFHISGTLGDDPAYQPSARKADIVARALDDGGQTIVTASKVRLTWNNETLLATISAATPALYQPALAGCLARPAR